MIEQAAEVLAFFLKTTGARYPVRVRSKPSASAELVMARLRDGATVGELRGLIAFKWDRWRGNADKAVYVRPSTLFRKRNFEEYRAEISAEVARDRDDERAGR